jgi:hypothetical protein
VPFLVTDVVETKQQESNYNIILKKLFYPYFPYKPTKLPNSQHVPQDAKNMFTKILSQNVQHKKTIKLFN